MLPAIDALAASLGGQQRSIISAMPTALKAAAILSLATLTFFDKFGSFLCVTMLASVFLSIIFFQALLGLVGPVKPHRLALKL